MASIDYVLLFCGNCGERRKIKPENCYELRTFGELGCWAEFRVIECPACKGRMKRAPEYQEPTYHGQAFWPVSNDLKWMS